MYTSNIWLRRYSFQLYSSPSRWSRQITRWRNANNNRLSERYQPWYTLCSLTSLCQLKNPSWKTKTVSCTIKLSSFVPKYLTELLPLLVTYTNPYHRWRPQLLKISSPTSSQDKSSKVLFFLQLQLYGPPFQINIQQSSSLAELNILQNVFLFF